MGFSQTDTTSNDSSKYFPSTLTALQNGELLDSKTFGGIVPKPGDNIIIPRQITVTVSRDVDFNKDGDDPCTIYIGGSLIFGKQGKLKLSTGSVVYGNSGSIIDRYGRDNASIIKIGNIPIYGGADTLIQGPLIFPMGLLPVSLLNITVMCINHNNIINWSTISESNIKSFQLFRSINGASWEKVSSIAASGIGRTIQTYLFKDSCSSIYMDPSLSPVCYYRIKIIENNGRAQYSFIRSIKNSEPKDNFSSR